MLPVHNHSVVITHPSRYRWLLAIVFIGATYSLGTYYRADESVTSVEPAIPYVDVAEPSSTPVQDTESDDTSAVFVSSPSSGDFYIPFKLSETWRDRGSPLAYQEPPIECLESMFNSGADCEGWRPDQPMDVVWSWVNSTDRAWRYAHAIIEHSVSGKPGKPNIDYNAPIAHLQNLDELRYSMRSVLQHFQPYVRQFNLMASDFATPDEFRTDVGLSEKHRLGQLPQWLDRSLAVADWHDGVVGLSVHHHGRFFDPYQDTTFNSFGIESQLRNLRGVSDVFVYLNDDMYFLRDLHPADFYTSTYGLVFRFDPNLQVPPKLDTRPSRGEWQPLRESNVLLSKRFGASNRPYTAHMAKAMSVSLLQEAYACFPEAFTRTALRPMRDVHRTDPGDLHTAFLLPQFTIERHREALLWSWAVGRMGGDDDGWDNDDAWTALGGERDEDIHVGGLHRITLNENVVSRSLRRAGYERPGATEYVFSSADGYPYYDLRKGGKGYPDLATEDLCTIKRDECFPSDLTSASGAFMHLAFMSPSCGDCVINRLVQRSGQAGLSEFLPSADREIIPASRGETVVTLPTVAQWEDGQFALTDVLSSATTPTIRVRDFVLRLLARYRFVLGNSPSEFVFLQGAGSAKKGVARLPADSDIAFACMNDDIRGDGRQVADILRGWQSERWPVAAQWEAL
ncbi:hypothetical protein PENSPDRAFT_271833 [Peniophora sp. CONT]|nr:hypothetical protein PENSPDRAFT_271833 [Peniophora sp. CONT]